MTCVITVWLHNITLSTFNCLSCSSRYPVVTGRIALHHEISNITINGNKGKGQLNVYGATCFVLVDHDIGRRKLSRPALTPEHSDNFDEHSKRIYLLADSCSAEWQCFSCAVYTLAYLLTYLLTPTLSCRISTFHRISRDSSESHAGPSSVPFRLSRITVLTSSSTLIIQTCPNNFCFLCFIKSTIVQRQFLRFLCTILLWWLMSFSNQWWIKLLVLNSGGRVDKLK